MRVLLLGGTGAIGRHVADMLAGQDGTEVFVTSRSARRDQLNLHFLQGNAKDSDFLGTLLSRNGGRKWDVIVDFMIYTTPEFLARRDQLLASAEQYIFLSSARVLAPAEGPMTEASPRLLDISQDTNYLASEEYALTKARQENALQHAKTHNWTVVRPYISYDSYRMQLGTLEKEFWLYRALHHRKIVVADTICNKHTTMTHGYDVARCIVALCGQEGAVGETFNLTGQDTITWSEVLDLYLDTIEAQCGFRPEVAYQDFKAFTQWYPVPYQTLYDRGHDRTFDPRKISQYIDVTSFLTMRDGLAQSLKSFLQQPKWRGIDWRGEALKDKFTGDHVALGEILGTKQKLKYLARRYTAIHR